MKGSPGYWRAKRGEVYTWISHHVQAGNGAPNFFLTFSCAEYQWEDIKRLIRERFRLGGLPEPDLDKNLVELVNDYTLIVQEYFQLRMKVWLETVGKKFSGSSTIGCDMNLHHQEDKYMHTCLQFVISRMYLNG